MTESIETLERPMTEETNTPEKPIRGHRLDPSTFQRNTGLPAGDEEELSLEVKDLNLYYNNTDRALFDINLPVPKNRVTAFIGPSKRL